MIFPPGIGKRSIPACTGEPRCRRRHRRSDQVYPRVYGGTPNAPVNGQELQGLSPRVRGNHPKPRPKPGWVGSIPACTGGTEFLYFCAVFVKGLSPRVRGNLFVRITRGLMTGSIPACTGEPVAQSLVDSINRVYPRVYGGTSPERIRRYSAWGLSPRVRGNRRDYYGGKNVTRSIPACTGEPQVKNELIARMWVYPRVYGGTSGYRPGAAVHRGLSPRVRGNHLPSRSSPRSLGSIPACTGEPRRRRDYFPSSGVYPRVYGGTTIPPVR